MAEAICKLLISEPHTVLSNDRRGKSLVFPFFRFHGNHVYFQPFVNSRDCDEQRALLEQWHQFDKQVRSSFELALICCVKSGNPVTNSAGTGTHPVGMG